MQISLDRSDSKPVVVDMFCGSGGMSYGFMKAGYHVLAGLDNDQAALYTFKRNHTSSASIGIDLNDNSYLDKIDTVTAGMPIDVIIGGPPCQGFSLTGPRNIDDPRNGLYLSMFNAVDRLRPRAVVIENVPGLANLYEGAIKNDVVDRFNKMGSMVY